MLRLFTLVLLLTYANTTIAHTGCFASRNSMGISIGTGEPNDLWGARINHRYNFFNFSPFNFYIDTSYANWKVKSDFNNNIGILAVAPVARANITYPNGYNFFLEISIGPSYKTTKYVGNTKTGSHFNFQDMIGFGTVIRDKFNISLYYVHYSNASLAKPNTGIDVAPMLSFSYNF